ncbi:MAG: 50S ribosomal protein L24 [bacterium]
MKVVKGDKVLILSGNNKGKTGQVLKVLPKKNRIIVEGINFIKKHARPTQKNPQGGIIEKEASIHVSNLMVICPKCDTPTRVGNTKLENGKKVRVCKNCGEMITAS